MKENRRDFLKQCGALTGLAVCAGAPDACAEQITPGTGQSAVLVDITRCIGCRRCEKACNAINTDLPSRTEESFQDQAVFQQRRRMDDAAYTVVNRYQAGKDPSRPVYAKFQCMHCLNAACVSACIVGALTRDPATGAIQYSAAKCIGCRYCMVACPFQVLAYEYKNALTPQVRKCTFCYKQRLKHNLIPACVQACPMEVMTFGKRSELLSMAKERIQKYPERYIDHVYGENEVGGTSWLYLSGVPFQDIDFPKLGYFPVPGYTEPIQHAIFKWFIPPLGLFAALGGIWWFLSRDRKIQQDGTTK